MTSLDGDSSLRAMLQLAMTPGLGPVRLHRLLAHLETPQRIVESNARALQQVDGIGSSVARSIVNGLREAERDVDSEIARVRDAGADLVSWSDPRYPNLLKAIPDPPPVLYVRGELRANDQLSAAIVGSRRCSAYGREQASRFAVGIAQAGLTIVSGGARGIDTEAHRGALRVNGRTIVVLGCGLGRIYPRENAELFDQIANENRGAVITEFPMTTPPNAENFPRRNRILSGLSLGTLVIEASERSGALITARLACEDHNREVMALPGRVDAPTAAGCLKIIREGWARLVTRPAEVLEALESAGSSHLLHAAEAIDSPGAPRASLFDAAPGDDGLMEIDAAAPTPTPMPSRTKSNDATPSRQSILLEGLTETQRKVIDALDRDPVELDDLSARTGLDVARLQADLTMLQIRGLITYTPAAGVRRRES